MWLKILSLEKNNTETVCCGDSVTGMLLLCLVIFEFVALGDNPSNFGTRGNSTKLCFDSVDWVCLAGLCGIGGRFYWNFVFRVRSHRFISSRDIFLQADNYWSSFIAVKFVSMWKFFILWSKFHWMFANWLKEVWKVLG